MNRNKEIQVKAERASKKVGRGEAATTPKIGKSATATPPNTNGGGGSGAIDPGSVKRGHDFKRAHD